MARHLPLIINPASGPERPVLQALNRGFGPDVDWQLLITRATGDATRHARALQAQGAPQVTVCGGDGTVKEVAAALAGSETALAIVPAGTGNALATELGIPLDIAQAARLASGGPKRTRRIDLGRIGEHVFVLRASLGLETVVLTTTPRDLKNELGGLAYPLTALNQLSQFPPTRYRLLIDGALVETTGVQCTVANSAQMGVSGLRLAQGVSVDDGLLDVIVVTTADLAALADIAASNFLGLDLGNDILHWQGREIQIEAEPAQDVAIGGDIVSQTPATITIWPSALNVIVPA